MRKIKLYIATSLNGKIARLDGDLEWLESLPNPEKTDYGFNDFYNSVDTTIQGYKTYELIKTRGIEAPYKGKKNYVFTRKQNIENTKHEEFISANHIEFVKKLKQKIGKDIWLIGGGQINTLLFNENLIDEIQLYIMPIVIPDGIELFENIPIQKSLKLVDSKSYSTSVVELKYVL